MPDAPSYGPKNPHPLSTFEEAELVWVGKYNKCGNRRKSDAGRFVHPAQQIEQIDEPHSRALAQGGLFDTKEAHHDTFRNRLIWGDNKPTMASLLEEFRGKIDLIYIDPPFDTGADFTMKKIALGEGACKSGKQQSILEAVAYKDIWGNYPGFMHERLLLMHKLLSETGQIAVHCGVQANHLMRYLLWDVFGKENEVEEIIWSYGTPSGGRAAANKIVKAHEYILLFAKNYGQHKYSKQYIPYSDKYLSDWFKKDEEGRLYTKRQRGRDESGKAIWSRQYLDESPGVPLSSVWSDIRQVYADPRAYKEGTKSELTDYPTQKPEKLLDRVIQMSTDEGDLVADFFCGSGTTGVAAERLGRRWLMSDLGRFAIHTARKRLIGEQRELHNEGKPYRPFDIYNLGRYERQWWQQESLKGANEKHRTLVLKFFGAEALANPPSPLLHGSRGGSCVHVDGIDGIFTHQQLQEVARAASGAGVKVIHCLAWEFEMEISTHLAGIEKETGVEVRLNRIPREIMEPGRTSAPPFFELAALSAKAIPAKGEKGEAAVDVQLVNFVPSLSEVPERELEALSERAAKHGFDFIDFWAVDFDWREGLPFKHHWQDYRTRKNRSLKTASNAAFVYPASGKHTICVKVVDVFGCDTSITLEART